MNSIPLNLKSKPWLMALLAAAIALSGGLAYVGLSGGLAPDEPEPVSQAAVSLPGVSALGRLEPAGEIVDVAAPLVLDGDRLAALFVQLGDPVQAGDSIAVLDSRDRLQDEVTAAQLQIELAEAKLAQVKAGAKQGAIATQEAAVTQQSAELAGQLRIQRSEIARIEAEVAGDRTAQTATVNRLEAELQTAEAELVRHKTLYDDGAISASLYDSKRLAVDTTSQARAEAQAILNRTNSTSVKQLQEARAELARLESTGQAQLDAARSTLNEVAEVRPVDIQLAQAELTAAKAALAQAQNNLAKATIQAPQAGQILAIHTRPGEQMSSRGIVALGQTEQMLAVAEVYQSDISRVQLGQTATVRGQAFEGELRGQVIEIGRQISQQNVFSGQPGENLDRRVVEVKIALDQAASQQVAGLSNLQVQAVIAVEAQTATRNRF